jgi:hypothetical protein
MKTDVLPNTAAPAAAVDDHVFLIGRPPVSDLIGFIRTMAVDGPTRSQAELVEQWRRANDQVRILESQEARLADAPEIGFVPPELNERRLRLLSDPLFRRAFQSVPSDVYMVDLDRLVVFQKHVDLTHVAKLRARLPANPTLAELFDFCLPSGREHPPVKLMQTAPNSYTFLSPSNDFRFLQAELLDDRQVGGCPAIGTTVKALGLLFGYGSNFLNALAVEGRLILGNGSHRAYALREHGIRHVPCIVQRLTRREELELAASTEVQHHPDLYLRAPRPPMLKDYFDPALRMIVPVARKHRLVKLTFGVETSDIPAQ